MKDYLEKAAFAHRQLRDISRLLSSYARSFAVTGNETMADNMQFLSEEVEKYAKMANDAVGELLTQSVRDAQQSSANMLGAAIAMAEIRKGKS